MSAVSIREELDHRLSRTAHLGAATRGLGSAADFTHQARSAEYEEESPQPQARQRSSTPPPAIRRASSYRKKQIEWCWPGRLALGMATIIDSDPSRGTSQLFAAWAGHITNGRAWPDGAACPKGGFVYIAGEDAIEEVCIPRFEAQRHSAQTTSSKPPAVPRAGRGMPHSEASASSRTR